MIPNLAVMIGFYIIFRMIETFLFDTSRYRNNGSHAIAMALSGIVILVTVVLMLDIVLAGSR